MINFYYSFRSASLAKVMVDVEKLDEMVGYQKQSVVKLRLLRAKKVPETVSG